MILLFRFSFYFVLSFSLLSIPIHGRLLFDHLNERVSPYTQAFYDTFQEKFVNIKEKTKESQESLQEFVKVDKVEKRSSGVLRKKDRIQKEDIEEEIEQSEEHSPEEKEALLKVFRNL